MPQITTIQRAAIIAAKKNKEVKVDARHTAMLAMIPKGFGPGCKDWNNPGMLSYKQKWLIGNGYNI